jgi:putative ABC transport system ATP-binding protein
MSTTIATELQMNPMLATQSVPEARPVIQLDHIHKTYKMGDVEVHALRGVSLTIREGEFVAIMGTSGSGKSTTMNIIGCLDRPTRGTYILDGEDVSEMSKDERADIRCKKIGFVFQGFNLLSRTSALENVELPMLYLGVDGPTRHQRAMEALAAVGLAGREQNHPNQLSGGQQQRVAVARSLVNNPALILADEPTGNLDSRTSVEVMEIFQRLNRERGITLVLVTHEPDIAEYAQRVVVFKDGKLKSDYQIEKQRDAAEELKNLPVVTDDDDDDDE